jgi:murein L,D-transpeptidase YafK
LELYVRQNGRFALKKTYQVCKMSGRVGPKLKSGDYQAPEGFYQVTARQLNPNSQYHLAFNVGYPNAFDRQNGRTGSAIMVHGDCVSIGCFAMTNKGIEEIYGYVAAAIKNGQREVPVHIFPFRMSESAIARESGGGGLASLFAARDTETTLASGAGQWGDFWRDLKKGYDLFERTGEPPLAYACKGRYAFSPGPGCQRIAGW